MKKIALLGKKRFSYKEVMESSEDYFALAERLKELTDQGKIRPVKRSGKVSFQPYFYKEYFVCDIKPDSEIFRGEINQLAPPLLEYYIAHENQYAEDRKWLLLLSAWMKREETGECSVKERSYEIFRDEKMLEGKDVRRILSRCSLVYEDLCCYRTFEPFFCIPVSATGAALVLENRDPWVSIRRAMEGKHTSRFLGREIMYVIYGEGRKADSAAENARLQEFLSGLDARPRQVLYCGDSHRACGSTFTTCREVIPDMEVLAFQELYEAMIRKAPKDPLENEPALDHLTKTFDASFAEMFEEAAYVKQVLAENRRIPQEILTLQDYLELCGDDDGKLS